MFGLNIAIAKIAAAIDNDQIRFGFPFKSGHKPIMAKTTKKNAKLFSDERFISLLIKLILIVQLLITLLLQIVFFSDIPVKIPTEYLAVDNAAFQLSLAHQLSYCLIIIHILFYDERLQLYEPQKILILFLT